MCDSFFCVGNVYRFFHRKRRAISRETQNTHVGLSQERSKSVDGSGKIDGDGIHISLKYQKFFVL